MSNEKEIEFEKFLNAINSESTYKILKLYFNNKKGFNLTETSRVIGENTSTTRDRLKKILDSKLIYLDGKNYYLSNLGSYTLNKLENFRRLSKYQSIFGEIPAEMIPTEFLEMLVVNLDDIGLIRSQWQFLNIVNQVVNDIKNDINKQCYELKLLGWKSLTLLFEIFQNYFKEISMNANTIQNLLKSFDFHVISSRDIISEINEKPDIRKILDNTTLKENISICEAVDKFNFIVFKYNQNVHIFLNKNNQFNFEQYFISENNKNIVNFYDSLFNHYLKQSIPLVDFLRKK